MKVRKVLTRSGTNVGTQRREGVVATLGVHHVAVAVKVHDDDDHDHVNVPVDRGQPLADDGIGTLVRGA